MFTTTVEPHTIGHARPLTIIAGPCVAESEDLCLRVAEALARKCEQLELPLVFKASYDKANRSSVSSKRGPGIGQGLDILQAVHQRLGVPTTTDIHDPAQAQSAAEAVQLLQIPAFLCRQTDLLAAAAETGIPVNVKKGQFLSPIEMANVVGKITANRPDPAAPPGIILTERGTFFGYNRLVNDFVALADMMDLGHPVCFDVTHSTQQPGGAADGKTSGGRPDRAPMLARCAVAAGVHALFIETHPDPGAAHSDAATMLPLERTLSLLDEIGHLHNAMRQQATHA